MNPRPYCYLVALCGSLLVLPTHLQSAEPVPRLDEGKWKIETPLKRALVAASALTTKEVPKPATAARDIGKRFVERSTKLFATKTGLAAGNPSVADAQPEPEGKLDRRKADIETPVEKLITGNSAAKPPGSGARADAPRPDPAATQRADTKATNKAQSTTDVEKASPRINKAADAASATHPQLKENVHTPPQTENPRVEPGKVRWHDDFAAARAAGRDSGKPVLLFQLLGRLDQRFT